jgi:hypothetical protein
VALLVDEPNLFPDHWIYIHDPSVRVGRIQNFKNWSADMVPDPSVTCLGLEYFCSATDPFWGQTDEDLMALATLELQRLGLLGKAKVLGRHSHSRPKSLPSLQSRLSSSHPDHSNLFGRSTAQFAGGRPQRHAPLQ